MKILLLFPILAYLFLLLVNIPLLKELQVLNIFWAISIEVPFFLFSSIFIVIYSVSVFFIYDWINIYLHYKIRKLDKEIIELKSDLYNWQEELIKKINSNFKESLADIKKDLNEKILNFSQELEETLEKIKKENDESLNKTKKESEKIFSKLNLIDKTVLDKIKSVKIL